MRTRIDVPMWGCVICANVHQAAGNDLAFWSFVGIASALFVLRAAVALSGTDD